MAGVRVPAAWERIIAERAGGCCEYCRSQEQFSPQSFSIEHITPRARGGPTALDNLALSCQGCNGHKATKVSARDPNSDEEVPLFDPRHQRWQDHFAWNEDFTLMIGLTPTGRATVEALRLNRAGVVNLRRALRRTGQHPPADVRNQ
ncbi:MAG: HNH endonuclease [Armatimonadota bacterium]|nr:HNH endonuclease [Armatimonadota bacterium]